MLSPVRNTVILQCFGAIGWATEERPAYKNLLLQNPLYENQGKPANPGFPGKWLLSDMCV